METDYIKYFEEFSTQLLFTFFMSDKFDIEDVPKEYEYDFPDIPASHLELDCSLTINNVLFSYDEYKKLLVKLGVLGMLNIQHIAFTNKDDVEFLQKIRQRIERCQAVFDIKNSFLIRNNCEYVFYEDPSLELSVISEEEIIKVVGYYKLISSYVKLQYDNLIKFKELFEKTFKSELNSSNKTGNTEIPPLQSTFYHEKNLFSSIALVNKINNYMT